MSKSAPKARIFSPHPEHAASLLQQLEQQGYKVEVLDPEDVPASPADLEISLEVCETSDVLRRAVELAAALGADIAVEPGALPMAERTAVEPSLLQEEPLPVALPSMLPSAAKPAAVPPAPEEELSPAAFAAEAHTVLEDDGSASPNFLSRAIQASAVALAALATALGELLASARDQARKYRERALIRTAEARAARERHLLELTRRRTQAQEQAWELETARKTAAAYLLQLQRESGSVLPGQDKDRRRRRPGPEPGAADESPASAWQRTLRRTRALRWEAILAGAASASALFVIGLTVASFHSRPALSSEAGQTHPGVTLPPSGSAPHAAPGKAAAPARPSPAVHSGTRKPPASQRRTPPRDRAAVANDVVIRHPAAPKPQRAQQDGWKHFSDMDN